MGIGKQLSSNLSVLHVCFHFLLASLLVGSDAHRFEGLPTEGTLLCRHAGESGLTLRY